MLERLEAAELFVSDLHVVMRAVNDPASLRPEAAPFGSPGAYRAAYAVGPRAIGRLAVRPLRRRELARNRFWSAYAGLWPAAPDPWLLQLPMLATAEELALELAAPELGEPGPVSCTVLLWPTGWATTLNLRFPGGVDAAALRQLSASIRGPEAGSPLRLNGQPANVSRVFRAAAQLVTAEIFNVRVDTSPTVAASYVAALAGQPDDARQYLGPENLPTRVRGELHSLLSGRPTELRELATIERSAAGAARAADGAVGGQPEMRLTPLSGRDFGLTRLEFGTLLNLTDNFNNGAMGPQRMHCLAGNVRLAWLQGLLLAWVVNEAAELAKASGGAVPGAVLELGVSAQTMLERMGRSPHLFSREVASGRHATVRLALGRKLSPQPAEG